MSSIITWLLFAVCFAKETMQTCPRSDRDNKEKVAVAPHVLAGSQRGMNHADRQGAGGNSQGGGGSKMRGARWDETLGC